MNKNILICLNQLDIGGLETAVITQATALQKKGYNIVIISKKGIYTEKMQKQGITCIDFNFELTDGYDLEKAKIIEKIISDYNIGQVHIHQFDCITSTFPACLNTNTPYIAFVHTGVLGTYDWFENHFISYKTIYNMYFNMAQKIVAITETAKNENKNKYNVDDSKYVVINNSINFDEKITNNNNIPEKIEKFLIVSRFANEKQTSIKNAINLFKKYHINHPQAQLTIVGSGECENRIRNEIQDIRENTIFLGARNDVIDIMLENDVVIALDRCILEAIAAKRIAIISGYEKMNEIITKKNIEQASVQNFSGRNLKECFIDEIIETLEKLQKQDIFNIVNENYLFAYNKLNAKNNVFVIEQQAENLNINKKIYFENEQILIDKIKTAKEETNKIYIDGKDAQNYLESRIRQKEKENEDLNLAIIELKKLNESISAEKEKVEEMYNKIINSRRWKYTDKIANIINKIKRKKD